MKILITGTAGFIGFHLVNKLAKEGFEVFGLDNINDYYDVDLKYARLKETGIDREEIDYNKFIKSKKFNNYHFIKLNLEDKDGIKSLFSDSDFDYVVHLAAQAGVRYSLINPHAYIDSNIQGFLNILEGCRQNPVKHLIYASSSSVYGGNTKMPFSVHDSVDHPVSLYAATKKANELMAHTYSHLYGIPTTGLRFFTVYGPWGRPDMALFLFTKAINEGKPIEVYNYGRMKRDFTYIDDIVESLCRLINKPPIHNSQFEKSIPDCSSSWAPYRVLNIGNHNPIQLNDFIAEIEKNLGKKTVRNEMAIQPGDVEATYADVEELENLIEFSPNTHISDGIEAFCEWYLSYAKNEL
ncbi:MAG: NAD-dependent epimerase [Ignavibacteriaceae bacterium]|nr:NAD-dependent epimerase [Ignavibacteriaceae bacterium]